MAAEKPVVVVTGSSTGIGLQVCLSLARRSYRVVATLRRPSAAPESLRAAGCDVQPLDVTCDESASNLRAILESKYGGCDILVNNAGWGMPGTLETLTIDAAKDVFEVNVWGVVRMIQQLVPLMRKRGGGLVLTVSSTTAWRGIPCSDVYTGSKQGVEGLMDSFRYSVQKDNIKVCMVNPGPTDTPFAKRFKEELFPGNRPEEEIPKLPLRLTQHYTEVAVERLSTGESAENCAEAIVDVIDIEFAKKIDDGSERATFWNPTSEYAKSILDRSRVFTDGISGEYDGWFKESYAISDKLQKEGDL